MALFQLNPSDRLDPKAGPSLLDVALNDMESALLRGEIISPEEAERLADEFLVKLDMSGFPRRDE